MPPRSSSQLDQRELYSSDFLIAINRPVDERVTCLGEQNRGRVGSISDEQNASFFDLDLHLAFDLHLGLQLKDGRAQRHVNRDFLPEYLEADIQGVTSGGLRVLAPPFVATH